MKRMKRFFGIAISLAIILPIISISAAASGIAATPNASTVQVDGVDVAFQAYTIKQNNYFKLRDLAMALSGSEKQFEVGFDIDKNTITITSGQKYTPVGGELLVSKTSGNETAVLSTSTVYLNGNAISLTAYNINGYNYFKLRDVAAALDFGVTYSSATKTIGIFTTTGYTADTSSSATDSSLVGTWSIYSAISAEGEEEIYHGSSEFTLTFFSNGGLEVKNDSQTATGSYTVRGDSLILTNSNGETEPFTYTIKHEGGYTKLILSCPDTELDYTSDKLVFVKK